MAGHAKDEDARFTAWMGANLARAADHFAVTVTGEPTLGWWLRSISAPTQDRQGRRRWLRVGTERRRDLPDPSWTGNADANAVTGIPKPRVLDSLQWEVPERDRAVRADLMTWVSGRVCSAEEILRAPLLVPDRWWTGLRRALDTLRATSTTRWAEHGGTGGRRVRAVFGDEVAERVAITRRETGHGDLHWANLIAAPEFALLDWEMWGLTPVGADAASLYCRTLLVPDTARRVRGVFADLLDSPEGRAAQVHAAAVLLTRADEFPDLATPLRRHVHNLMTTAA